MDRGGEGGEVKVRGGFWVEEVNVDGAVVYGGHCICVLACDGGLDGLRRTDGIVVVCVNWLSVSVSR